MKKRLCVAIGLTSFLLGGCSFGEINQMAPSTEDINIKELVQDYSSGIKNAEYASINSEELIVLEKSGKQAIYNLPESEFFVSIAPYVENTHPCEIHNLTGCRGEMGNRDFAVHIEDTEGNVIVDDTLQSQDNGFIDMWLPKNKTYNVSISHEGKTAESEVTTFKDDNTCIADMKLTDSKA